MRDDTPDDLVHDVFASAVFPAHPIGREIVGSPETINAMDRDAIAGFHAAHYHPSNVVVAAANAPRGDRPARPAYHGDTDPLPVVAVEDDLEQVHLVLGMRALPRHDPD